MAKAGNKKRFSFGLLLICAGWLICLDPFLCIVGIPVFISGAILVLTSEKSALLKISTIALPLVLWGAGFELVLFFMNKKTALTIIVSYPFKGQARIVYGEPGGIVPQTSENRMELLVPVNGVLIIRDRLESNLQDIQYYYTDKNGGRNKMASLKNPEDKNLKHPAVYFEGTASSASADPKTAPGLDYVYDSFYVFENDSVQKETQTEEMKHNSLTDSLVKISRQKTR